jgi:glutaredoxin
MMEPMPSHRIILYATGDCPHCDAARAALEAWGGPFEERNPLSSREVLKELLLCSAVGAVPTIVVSGQVLVGFDADRLDQVLREPPPEPEPADEYTPEDLPQESGAPDAE